jgi:hypothetical protein
LTDDTLKLIAVVLATLWLLSGILAWKRLRSAAVAINMLFATPIAAIAAGSVARALFAREGFVQQYGQAALGDLPFNAAVLAAALIAIVTSVLSLKGHRWLFLASWLATGSLLALVIYLAFFFKIF